MHFGRIALGAALVCGLAAPAIAKAPELTLRDKEQAACYNDAQKLCADAIPDEGKITTCMEAKKAQVSEACAKFFK